MDKVKVKRALISVTDKTGVAQFAKALADEFGVEIVSTGGTAKVIAEAGVDVRPIDDLTGFPEMMEGRVKTLHPKVHGGLLADRSKPDHLAQAEAHGIGMIDMVVVNLYAFEETIAKPDVTLAEAIENIDIGGPSMLRSAAKNFDSVAVVTNPDDYEGILGEMRANEGDTLYETRKRLAREVFEKTSAYDNAIFSYLDAQEAADGLPQSVRIFAEKVQDLRYGENPHQEAAFYRFADTPSDTLAGAEMIQGKALSYNNYLDTDGAWAALREFDEQPACVIVKHMNPCGAAIADDITTAYQRAHEGDPISAFGGVMAFNRTVPADVIEAIYENGQFFEVMIAPDYTPEAIELLTQKPDARVLKTGGIQPAGTGREFRAIEGGMLMQGLDSVAEDPANFEVVSERQPTPEEMEQLLFAWRVCKSVKSNAILLAKEYMTVGVGAGQMSRVDAAKIAVGKAEDRAKGSVCGSDAFMPFPDALEVCADAGATAVIQPGGSKRDDEVIALANERDIAVVFTGHRHFRH